MTGKNAVTGKTGRAQASGTGGAGSHADSPWQVPARGWRQVLRRALRESQQDGISLLAAGVAFYGFLALFPTLIALVTLVGLVADPRMIAEQMQSLTEGLPAAVRELIAAQLAALTSSSRGALTAGLVVSLLGALWSASSATTNLVTTVNIAYREDQTRGWVRLRVVALLLTVAAVVFLVLALALIALVPVVLPAIPLGVGAAVLAQIGRWGLLLALISIGLAVLYRVAPSRRPPKFRWVSVGSVVAALLWLLGSAGFSLYVTYFGHYNKTYGALGSVIVLLLWLFLTSYVVLLGAEINAQAECQTGYDTAAGAPRPMGHRHAVVADSMAGPGDG